MNVSRSLSLIAIAAAWVCGPLQAAETTTADVTLEALDEIIVTARRREENLQKVPAAISVASGEQLDSSYTVNPQQLSQMVPSLYYNSANPRNTAYTIRGLGSNTLSISAANDGMEPGVGFYVDQVYHGRPASAAFDFTDIERVEVLRGPQGTLFGKNTTGGAIHVVSREPSFVSEAKGEISLGDFDFLQGKASLSGPLTETLAGRVSAQLTRRDGVIRNVVTDQDLNSLNNVAVRAQLLYKPSEDLKLRLSADVADFKATCCTQIYLRVGQSLRNASRQFSALAAGLNYTPPSTNVYDRSSDIDTDLYVDTQDGGVSLLADWSLGFGALTAVSAWRYWDWDVANDRDYTGIPIQLVQRIPSRQDQYSQELRLASITEGPLNYISGLYFFKQTITGTGFTIYGPEAAYWLLNPATFSVPIPRNLLDGYSQFSSSRFDMKSYAAFGELNYELPRQVTATLGLRFTHEDKQGTYATTVSGGLNLAGLPALTVSELNRAKLAILRPQQYALADRGGSLSGRANLAWQASNNLLAYLSYAKGFKSGGLNMSGLPLNAQNQPTLATGVIDDEGNKNFELGLKSTLPNGQATVNLAAFHTTVTQYQTNIVSNLETAALRSYPANIPEVVVQGVELDATAILRKGLALRASMAYTHGEYTDYPAGPCPLELQTATTVACNLSGKRLAGLSRWVGTLGFDFNLPAGNGEFSVHGDWHVRSGYFNDTSDSRYTWIGGHGVVNGSVGYEFGNGWQINLFARNLFNKDHLTALTIQSGNSGLILGQPNEPRLLGLTVKMQL